MLKSSLSSLMNFSRRCAAFVLIAAVVGCGGSAETPSPATTAPIVTAHAVADAVTDTPAPVADSGPPATVTQIPTQTNTPTPRFTATPTSTPTETPTPTITPTPTDTPTPTPSPTYTPRPAPPPPPPVNASPGNPQPYLSRYRLLTYYGSPLGRGLGILGNNPRYITLQNMRHIVKEYQDLDSSKYVMPTYHMITSVADTNEPDFRHHVGLGVMEEWVGAANASGAAIIIDIQPGRVSVVEEVNRIKHLLYNPHVHLAIDPEFTMSADQLPNVHVGQLSAAEINAVQEILNQIALEIGVKRVLILHQFKGSMLPDKGAIINYPHVEMVIDSDGTFNTDIKVANYIGYSVGPAFEYGGIKLFYNYDDYLLSAEDVMSLSPPPAVIIYQ